MERRMEIQHRAVLVLFFVLRLPPILQPAGTSDWRTSSHLDPEHIQGAVASQFQTHQSCSALTPPSSAHPNPGFASGVYTLRVSRIVSSLSRPQHNRALHSVRTVHHHICLCVAVATRLPMTLYAPFPAY